MKKPNYSLTLRGIALALSLGAALVACQSEENLPLSDSQALEIIKYQHGDIIPGKYIVTMNPTGLNLRKDMNYESVQAAMRKSSSMILAKYRISEASIDHVYGNTIEGFSVSLSEEQYELLVQDPSVKAIEPDRIIAFAPPPGKGPGGDGGGGSTSQSTPWGINRVGGPVNYSGSGNAYIVDTGIDLDHPDLNVANYGFNAFTSGKDAGSLDDGNGHGTHVAGTVAAKNNTIGVVGVAADALVIPVKVLNSRGSGSYSGVIAGVNYVGGNGKTGDVANMSLGGPVSDALDDAVESAAAKGIKFAIAAGNSAADAANYSPARANGTNIYTVSSMAKGDVWSSFSNFGNPPVDFCAPGSSILSTWKDGGYNTISGTSMAAPHVAGILLLGSVKSGGTVSGDPDGNPDTIATH
ncbi:S8 family serine peptidase [Algoriphagus boritolerans]|uniref:Peptidase inhibitor I9 n=1 Tax=Algoriphagus boritolerans DSM 17298 = JCM 18970 TaxID=1120964 RepID=A0A1H5WNX7_9BACT|nr:S8 family serine peptidase [Algoriphagus boritolerans]SEG00946.1 Peptidase inhibitor I9 [Algoriphagus boritolerans DSM 17298 = JCM 18970]